MPSKFDTKPKTKKACISNPSYSWVKLRSGTTFCRRKPSNRSVKKKSRSENDDNATLAKLDFDNSSTMVDNNSIFENSGLKLFIDVPIKSKMTQSNIYNNLGLGSKPSDSDRSALLNFMSPQDRALVVSNNTKMNDLRKKMSSLVQQKKKLSSNASKEEVDNITKQYENAMNQFIKLNRASNNIINNSTKVKYNETKNKYKFNIDELKRQREEYEKKNNQNEVKIIQDKINELEVEEANIDNTWHNNFGIEQLKTNRRIAYDRMKITDDKEVIYGDVGEFCDMDNLVGHDKVDKMLKHFRKAQTMTAAPTCKFTIHDYVGLINQLDMQIRQSGQMLGMIIWYNKANIYAAYKNKYAGIDDTEINVPTKFKPYEDNMIFPLNYTNALNFTKTLKGTYDDDDDQSTLVTSDEFKKSGLYTFKQTFYGDAWGTNPPLGSDVAPYSFYEIAIGEINHGVELVNYIGSAKRYIGKFVRDLGSDLQTVYKNMVNTLSLNMPEFVKRFDLMVKANVSVLNVPGYALGSTYTSYLEILSGEKTLSSSVTGTTNTNAAASIGSGNDNMFTTDTKSSQIMEVIKKKLNQSNASDAKKEEYLKQVREAINNVVNNTRKVEEKAEISPKSSTMTTTTDTTTDTTTTDTTTTDTTTTDTTKKEVKFIEPVRTTTTTGTTKKEVKIVKPDRTTTTTTTKKDTKSLKRVKKSLSSSIKTKLKKIAKRQKSKEGKVFKENDKVINDMLVELKRQFARELDNISKRRCKSTGLDSDNRKKLSEFINIIKGDKPQLTESYLTDNTWMSSKVSKDAKLLPTCILNTLANELRTKGISDPKRSVLENFIFLYIKSLSDIDPQVLGELLMYTFASNDDYISNYAQNLAHTLNKLPSIDNGPKLKSTTFKFNNDLEGYMLMVMAGLDQTLRTVLYYDYGGKDKLDKDNLRKLSGDFENLSIPTHVIKDLIVTAASPVCVGFNNDECVRGKESILEFLVTTFKDKINIYEEVADRTKFYMIKSLLVSDNEYSGEAISQILGSTDKFAVDPTEELAMFLKDNYLDDFGDRSQEVYTNSILNESDTKRVAVTEFVLDVFKELETSQYSDIGYLVKYRYNSSYYTKITPECKTMNMAKYREYLDAKKFDEFVACIQSSNNSIKKVDDVVGKDALSGLLFEQLKKSIENIDYELFCKMYEAQYIVRPDQSYYSQIVSYVRSSALSLTNRLSNTQMFELLNMVISTAADTCNDNISPEDRKTYFLILESFALKIVTENNMHNTNKTGTKEGYILAEEFEPNNEYGIHASGLDMFKKIARVNFAKLLALIYTGNTGSKINNIVFSSYNMSRIMYDERLLVMSPDTKDLMTYPIDKPIFETLQDYNLVYPRWPIKVYRKFYTVSLWYILNLKKIQSGKISVNCDHITHLIFNPNINVLKLILNWISKNKYALKDFETYLKNSNIGKIIIDENTSLSDKIKEFKPLNEKLTNYEIEERIKMVKELYTAFTEGRFNDRVNFMNLSEYTPGLVRYIRDNLPLFLSDYDYAHRDMAFDTDYIDN